MLRESTAGPIYSGTHERSLDLKNRVTIPAKWLSGEGEMFHVVPRGKEYLAVLPAEEFRRHKEQIEKAISDPIKAIKAMRLFYGKSEDVSTDKQGRILLPEDYCHRTGLEGKVCLVGMHSHFEIWNAERYASTESEDESVLTEIFNLIRI